jgi:tRNA(Ile)-lysidine synthase
MRLRLYRHAILLLTESLRRISFRHLEAIDRLATKGPPNGSLNLPGGVQAIRSYGELTFSCGDSDSTHDGFELSVNSPGSYDLPCGYRIFLYRSERSLLSDSGGRMEMAVDLKRYPFPWTVRSFRPGDRLIPVGMTGHRKVKELFIDEKVPRPLRSRIPLFFSSKTLFWVAGLRKAGFASPEAHDVVSIKVELLEFDVDAATLA